jgi:L-threonylcarbamoyladenylate synthase
MKTIVVSPSASTISMAAEIIRKEGLVGMPTETVYGLGGAAFSETAVAGIFDCKERPSFDPLIVHVAIDISSSTPATTQLDDLQLIESTKLSSHATTISELLIKCFWPGPLTLVLPKKFRVPDLVTSGLQTIAIRMPSHPIARALIEASETPLAAPSANRFGRISPTRAAHVLAELEGRIELIIDGGQSEIGVESTVVSVGTDGELTLLRPGGVSKEEIENITGEQVRSPAKPTHAAQASPGMGESHYAPRKSMILLPVAFERLADQYWKQLERSAEESYALLAFSGEAESLSRLFQAKTGKRALTSVLSKSGNLSEAARNLFAQMRHLDSTAAELILAEPPPTEVGLGHAIKDRLRRASKVNLG